MKQSKQKFLFLGALLIAFGLGAAAFAYLPALFTSESAQASEGSGRVMEFVAAVEIIEDGNVQAAEGTVQVSFEEAEGLPAISPDVDGLYLSHSAESISVGIGNISIEINAEQVNDQEPVEAISAVHSEGDIDIVISDSTEIYVDTTPHPQPGIEQIEQGEMVIQRTVQPASLDGLTSNMLIRAWGIMESGQLMADVVVYEPIR